MEKNTKSPKALRTAICILLALVICILIGIMIAKCGGDAEGMPDGTEAQSGATTKMPDDEASVTTAANASTNTTTGTTTGEPTVTECAHMYEVSETVDATCTLKGHKTYTCAKCGHTYSEETETLAHTYTDATCLVPKTCSVCGATEGDLAAHTYTDATCLVPKTCSVCGATEGDLAAHTYTGGTCITAATCSVCGKSEGLAKGHTFEGDSCSICGTPKPSEGLELELVEDDKLGKHYIVKGIGDCQTTDLVMPNVYNGLPVTEIGNEAFYWNTSLTSVVIPHGITKIGSYAFEYCRGLTSITLPEGLTEIGYSTFLGCESLTGISLPDSLKILNGSAFYDCEGLTSIVLPDSLKTVGEDIFKGCANLTSIYCELESRYIGWRTNWNADCAATVYWGNEWEYVDGVPTVK